MNDSYVENVVIKKTEPLDIQGISGIVKVTVKNIELICFSPNFEQFASMIEDTKIQVFLSLMTTHYSINKKSKLMKNVKSFEKPKPQTIVFFQGISSILSQKYL